MNMSGVTFHNQYAISQNGSFFYIMGHHNQGETVVFPASLTSPEPGVSRPDRIRSKVDFPQPDVPTNGNENNFEAYIDCFTNP